MFRSRLGGMACCVRHLTCQVSMDPVDKKSDRYSTSRLFIKMYLVLSGHPNHYSDQDQWFPRYIE